MSVEDDLARGGVIERAFCPHGKERREALAALDRVRDALTEDDYEVKFWRRFHDIDEDVALMLPSDQPPPPEAIELGRKLMVLYRPKVLAAARSGREE